MTKLCPRGKAAAKRKFKVYPSAYANAYASKICAGKIKDPSGVKRKDFRGPKPAKAMGGRIFKQQGGPVKSRETLKKISKAAGKLGPAGLAMDAAKKIKKTIKKSKDMPSRVKKMGGGMMKMPSATYKKGGKALKPVDKEKNPGLAKLPTKVRNKMGFMKKGGSVKKFPDLSGDGKVTMKDVLMGRGVIKRPKKRGGGLMEATSRLRAQGLKMGGIARGCGAVMGDRRKKTKMY